MQAKAEEWLIHAQMSKCVSELPLLGLSFG